MHHPMLKAMTLSILIQSFPIQGTVIHHSYEKLEKNMVVIIITITFNDFKNTIYSRCTLFVVVVI